MLPNPTGALLPHGQLPTVSRRDRDPSASSSLCEPHHRPSVVLQHPLRMPQSFHCQPFHFACVRACVRACKKRGKDSLVFFGVLWKNETRVLFVCVCVCVCVTVCDSVGKFVCVNKTTKTCCDFCVPSPTKAKVAQQPNTSSQNKQTSSTHEPTATKRVKMKIKIWDCLLLLCGLRK